MCYVYKGERKQDHYLYLPAELEELDQAELPAALMDMLGELSMVVKFELNSQRRLPQAEATQVLEDMSKQGFYLQMPKKDMREEENRWFN